MADAAEADDSAEAMDAVFDGVQQSEVGPNSDDLSMGFQDAQVEVDSQESEAEKAAKAEAVAAKTAKVISGLTPDRVRQLNDLMHALDMNCNTSVRKVVDGMRSLAMNSEQLWMMLESFDVERAAMREGFGKVTEKGLSAQRVVFKYEKEYRASESANRLEELKETNGTLVVLAKEMENPTDDAVQAEWDKLPEHEREARTLAAEYGVGLPRIHTLMQQARDAEATKRKPQPDVAVLIARCRKELEENGRKTFDDRIAIARKSESSYTNAIKHLEERFPQRGEYLKATRDIRDILSGTVAPRPDPAPPPAVSYDDCVKSMNQAQAVADEAAIERDLLQPGSEQYFMDLHKFNRLRAEVAVMQEPVYMPPVDATVELTGEEAKAAADAAHAESVHWKGVGGGDDHSTRRGPERGHAPPLPVQRGQPGQPRCSFGRVPKRHPQIQVFSQPRLGRVRATRAAAEHRGEVLSLRPVEAGPTPSGSAAIATSRSGARRPRR